MLHLPEVAYNFTRRKPRYANEWQIWYYAATDPGIAHTLGRRFCWREMALWKEQLVQNGYGRRATAIVGERDNIINSKGVASYVYFGDMNYTDADVDEWKDARERWTGMGELELIWMPKLDHGQVMLMPSRLPVVTNVVERYCRKDIDGGGFIRMDKQGP